MVYAVHNYALFGGGRWVGENEISKKNIFSGVIPISKLPQAHCFSTE